MQIKIYAEIHQITIALVFFIVTFVRTVQITLFSIYHHVFLISPLTKCFLHQRINTVQFLTNLPSQVLEHEITDFSLTLS